jgi:hypothetical protein
VARRGMGEEDRPRLKIASSRAITRLKRCRGGGCLWEDA